MKIAEPNLGENLLVVSDEGFSDFIKETEGELFELEIKTASCRDMDISHRDWKASRFHGCNLSGASFEGSYFADVVFKNCDLSNANMRDCVFSRVRFEQCRLTGTIAFGAAFHEVVITGCAGDYGVFSESRGKLLSIEESKLQGASMTKLSIKKLLLSECDLSNVDLRDTMLKGVDLRTCNIANVSWSDRELRGAVISSLQALDLVCLLGVTVKD